MNKQYIEQRIAQLEQHEQVLIAQINQNRGRISELKLILGSLTPLGEELEPSDETTIEANLPDPDLGE